MRGTYRPLWIFLVAVVALAGVCPAQAAAPTRVKAMRLSGDARHTRAVFDLSGPSDPKLFQLAKPDRVVLDFPDARLGAAFHAPDASGLMRDVRTGRHGKRGLRVVLDLTAGVQPKSFLLKPSGGNGYRLVLDMQANNAAARSVKASLSVPSGERKVLIAIDPGHGGKDVGARGPDGLYEKTATLAIAKRLAALIDRQKGMKALLTRTGDYYVPLEKRFEIARAHKADLFVSIHANSCPHHCDARGASVWVLSTHGKESEAGKWLARSENASDLIGVSLDDKSHTLASVLLDLSQGASMQASKQVGHDVLGALKGIIALYKPRVQHANFVVLRSPDVPSILVETAFISSRHDERLLRSSRYRGKIAHAILTGVERYFSTTPPPGTWFAAQWARKHGVKVASTSGASRSSTQRADSGVQDLHRVNSGETLSGIAQQYGVSVDAIKNANNMESNMVRAGSMLAIPAG